MPFPVPGHSATREHKSSTFRAGEALVTLSVTISYPNTSRCVAQPVTVLCDSNGFSPSLRSPIA